MFIRELNATWGFHETHRNAKRPTSILSGTIVHRKVSHAGRQSGTRTLLSHKSNSPFYGSIVHLRKAFPFGSRFGRLHRRGWERPSGSFPISSRHPFARTRGPWKGEKKRFGWERAALKKSVRPSRKLLGEIWIITRCATQFGISCPGLDNDRLMRWGKAQTECVGPLHTDFSFKISPGTSTSYTG